MQNMKKVLVAIETTCDETSIALIIGRKIIKNLVYSQVELHSKYKGVVPEVASRSHSEKIIYLIKKILPYKNFDAIVFSRGPGLLGPLIIGSISAQTLSEYFKIPLIGVNHLEGHLLGCEIENEIILDKFKFPLIALIVSGGHSELWLVKDYGEYRLLGSTRDDAAGEAFDKVARLLGLGYPGGKEIEKLASLEKEPKINFPIADVKNSLDFSFSGLKTAVSYYIKSINNLNKAQKISISAAFQKAIIESLLKKTLIAFDKYKVKQIVVCGGVSANSYLRNHFVESFLNRAEVIFPEKKYCMDNAAMIGVCGFRRFEKKSFKNKINIESDLIIESWR